VTESEVHDDEQHADPEHNVPGDLDLAKERTVAHQKGTDKDQGGS
jgi:hypothetical protein